jgi:hypothetical protein
MEQGERDQQVSNERGDHAESKTLLRATGHDAEGRHPGLGEEGGRVPCGTEEPQDQRGYKHGPVVDLVVQVMDGLVRRSLQPEVWVCEAANDSAANVDRLSNRSEPVTRFLFPSQARYSHRTGLRRGRSRVEHLEPCADVGAEQVHGDTTEVRRKMLQPPERGA